MKVLVVFLLLLCFEGFVAVYENITSESKELLLSEVENRVRAKRGIYYPGTNWCGPGHRGSGQLGRKVATDLCCKAHDHCPHTINTFQKKYGLWNSLLYTMSLCSCDERFYSCLKKADTKTSNKIGCIFFNVLKTKCFTLQVKTKCTKWRSNRCIENSYDLKAEKKKPTPY